MHSILIRLTLLAAFVHMSGGSSPAGKSISLSRPPALRPSTDGVAHRLPVLTVEAELKQETFRLRGGLPETIHPRHMSPVLLPTALGLSFLWVVVGFHNEGVSGILLVLGYFCSLSFIRVVMKLFFTQTGFRFPLFVTGLHFLASALVALFLQHMLLRKDDAQQRDAPQRSTEPEVTPWFFVTRILPIATLFALSVVLNNWSLTLLSASTVTALGMWTPLCTFLMDVGLGAKYSWKAWAWIVAFSVSCTVCSFGIQASSRLRDATSTNVLVLGIGLSIGAVFSRAARTAMQSVIMRPSDVENVAASTMMHPLRLLAYSAPAGAVVMFVWSAFQERLAPFTALAAMPSLSIAFLFGTCCLAAALNTVTLFTVKILGATNSQLMGSVANLIAMVSAVMLLAEDVSPIMWVGAGLVLLSGWGFNHARKEKVYAEKDDTDKNTNGYPSAYVAKW